MRELDKTWSISFLYDAVQHTAGGLAPFVPSLHPHPPPPPNTNSLPENFAGHRRLHGCAKRPWWKVSPMPETTAGR